ncbi:MULTISPECIES: hypothetical protein [unclassified Streptomyces]|uniref:hypothetical protein n=1 Tax=unclassified Streptomyces TaxID=2593676 RepID=UPI00278C86B5|nr:MULTISPECIES: hypothetical protein [unclassified Streptomyces]
MGFGFILVPLVLYLLLVTPLCVKVGAKTSTRTGWAMAAGCIGLPLALFVAMVVASS